MTRVLITGASGFIGSYLVNHLQGVEIQTLSLQDASWNDSPLHCDVIVHCAGIAHASRRISSELYRQVNEELPVAFAAHAKKQGVKQFIFLSTLLVYGTGHIGAITTNTTPNPKSSYAMSKWAAEQQLMELADESFRVLIYRLPLVYGTLPKGNLKTLLTLSKYLFVFPKFVNQRSVLSLDLLQRLISDKFKHPESGVLHVADPKAVSTAEIVTAARSAQGRRTFLVAGWNPLLRFFRQRIHVIGKIFGDAYYLNDLLVTDTSTSTDITSWLTRFREGGLQ